MPDGEDADAYRASSCSRIAACGATCRADDVVELFNVVLDAVGETTVRDLMSWFSGL